jgi:hypothetical protein
MSRPHRKRAFYVVAPNEGIEGKILENKLPTFWSNRLSTIFGTTRPSTTHHTASESTPRKIASRRTEAAVNERRAKAIGMRESGFSYGEIGNALGVSKSQAFRYCRRY